MKEENVATENPAEGEALPVLGKFKNVDALARAYSELEAEFTRRSQRLKALEERAEGAPSGGADPEAGRAGAADGSETLPDPEALYRAVTENEAVKSRVVGDYLQSLHGVPLMGSAGTGVTAPVQKPKSIAEAGALALGYIRENRKN